MLSSIKFLHLFLAFSTFLEGSYGCIEVVVSRSVLSEEKASTMFKNLKIGTQIALGFGSVIVLFTVVSAIAFLGLNNTYQGFVDYRGLALDNHFSSQIEANLLSIQLNAKEFLFRPRIRMCRNINVT